MNPNRNKKPKQPVFNLVESEKFSRKMKFQSNSDNFVGSSNSTTKSLSVLYSREDLQNGSLLVQNTTTTTVQPMPMTNFQKIPPEIKEEIFKLLGPGCLKIVRLVCKEWNAIAWQFLRSHITLCDYTYQTVFAQRNLQSLVATSLKEKKIRGTTFLSARRIRFLCLNNPSISSENMNWLITQCSNLTEIDIVRSSWEKRSRIRFHHFLRNIVGVSLPVGINLKVFTIHAVAPICYNRTTLEPCNIDCSFLRNCTSLKYFNVHGAITILLSNISNLPASLTTITYIALKGGRNEKNPLTLRQTFYGQDSYPTVSYSIPTQNMDKFKSLFTNLRVVSVHPNTAVEQQTALKIIPKVNKVLKNDYVTQVIHWTLNRTVEGWA